MLKALAISLAALLALAGSAVAQTQSQVGNVVVSASVIGIKPIVNSFSPSTGVANATTAITQIVGRNFTGASIVTLDDANSTVLTGTITVETGCRSTGADCGNAGGHNEGYERITGLTVPAGLAPGGYNILVTGSTGTNTTSDSLFVVSAPTASTAAAIVSVDPDPLVVLNASTDTVRLSVNHSTAPSIAYSVTQQGGTFAASTGSISLTSQSGSISLDYSAGATPGYYLNTFQVDDDGEATTTFDDSRTTGFFVLPPF